MSNKLVIPNGAILNVFLPKKKGSLKRRIMNIEAKLVKKFFGFERLLNHTAMLEQTPDNLLVWEARVLGGVSATHIENYAKDAFFFITHNNIEGNLALSRVKSQAGKSYDVRSWYVYLRYIISRKWKGDTTFEEYSKKWFCSELVDYAHMISETPEKSTPNHVYKDTRHNEIWAGTYADFIYQLNNGAITIK